MSQRPATTVINLINTARNLRLNESLVPPETVRTVLAAQVALTDDGRATLEALRNTLPWQARDFTISGVSATGTNVAQQLRIRQPSRLVYLDAVAKTVPSGGAWNANVVIAGGATLENVAIVSGAFSGTSTANAAIPAGSLLQLNVTSAAGAAELTVTAWIAPDLG